MVERILPDVPRELVVLLQGNVVGTLHREQANGSYIFTYDRSWREDPTAFPLSLSLPLAGEVYEGLSVAYYLRGLLPDNESRLNTIAHQYGVAADDLFALLAYLGEDCPGAVQFVRPERLSLLRENVSEPVDWVTEQELAQLLRELKSSTTYDYPAVETGQFSLPGALPKLALTWYPDAHRWGRPSGRIATTHILKPPIRGIPYHNENEHLCLELARYVNCPAASSYILRVEDQTAIVVERYDRMRQDGSVIRLHQEDLSQALGLNPRLKYAAEGAPGVFDAVTLLRDQSTLGLDDVYRFLRAVAFNWIIGGTDAHARNYAVLIAARGNVRLAPLYDLASALLLGEGEPAKFRMAMAVGGHTRLGDIDRVAWETQAKQLRLPPERLFHEIHDLCHSIIDGVTAVTNGATLSGVDENFAVNFSARIQKRASECKKLVE